MAGVADAALEATDVGNVDLSDVDEGFLRETAELANIARDLVKSVRKDLAVDWADRASTEAAISRTIRRLLREHEYK